MAKIYTRTGDAGETSLVGGRRVRKDDSRIEVIGAVDEFNAALGVARMELARSGAAFAEFNRDLAQVQHRLFDLGAELAGAEQAAPLADTDVADVEAAIDRNEAKLDPLRAFILPGGAPAASQLHYARCVCRRCERRLVELAATAPVREQVLRYINRLSDFLFVLARAVNHVSHVPDVLWESRERVTNGGRHDTPPKRE